jgi:hypothetical protein
MELAMYFNHGSVGVGTVIASESCFARGVDHCRSSEDDHLMAVHGTLQFQRGALRTAVRTCLDTIDLILTPKIVIVPSQFVVGFHPRNIRARLELSSKEYLRDQQ